MGDINPMLRKELSSNVPVCVRFNKINVKKSEQDLSPGERHARDYKRPKTPLSTSSTIAPNDSSKGPIFNIIDHGSSEIVSILFTELVLYFKENIKKLL